MRTMKMGVLAAAAMSLGLTSSGAIIDESTMMRQPDPQPKRRRRVAKSPALGMPYGKRPYGNVPASINRWTGKPHEHRREVARRTTHPGTEARRLAMAQASNPA